MKKGVFMSSDSTTTHSWRKLQNGAEIRGSEALLTDEFARRIGYVFAQWLAERLGTTTDRLTLAVGRDSRHSGPRLKAALIRGMTAADCDVFDCDLCTTPAMYMATVAPETHANGAIMVTGSYYSFDRNGFKFILREGHLSAEDVTGLIARAERAEIPERLVRKIDFLEIYAERLRQMVRRRLEDDALKPLLGLHVVGDAGGGAGGALVREETVDRGARAAHHGAERAVIQQQAFYLAHGLGAAAVQGVLEDVVHPPRDARKVPRAQGGDKTVRIRAAAGAQGVQPGEELRRGAGEVRHADDGGGLRQGRQGFEDLAAAPGQRRAAQEAEGHVRARAQRRGKERILPQRGARQIIQRTDDRRGVRGAAAHARTDRYLLGYTYIGPGIQPCGLEEGLCRLDGYVSLVRGDVAPVRLRAEEARLPQLHVYLVRELRGLHDHFELVKAVRAPAQHVEREVQLRPRGHREAAHRQKRRGMSSTPLSRKGPDSPFFSV